MQSYEFFINMQNRINKKIYKTLALAHAAMQRGILVALAGIMVLLVMYVYFVGAAIMSTIAYKDARVEIASLQSELASLETDYINQKEVLTKELAINLGFTNINNKDFITRTVIVGHAD